MGIEPTSKAWEAFILPMNYARGDLPFLFYHIPRFCKVKFSLNFLQKYDNITGRFFSFAGVAFGSAGILASEKIFGMRGMRRGKIFGDGHGWRFKGKGADQRVEKRSFADFGGMSPDKGGLRDPKRATPFRCISYGGTAAEFWGGVHV